jgi:HSP20 family molecular chaperone IbpA
MFTIKRRSLRRPVNVINVIDDIFNSLNIEQGYTAQFDAFETSYSVVVRLNVPGCRQGDAICSRDPESPDIMILEGEIKPFIDFEASMNTEDYAIRRRPYGKFRYSVEIPDGTVDFSEFKASLKDGVFSVIMPKKAKPEEKKPTSIPVN